MASNPTGILSIRSSLQISQLTGQAAPPYRSYPTSFTANMYGFAGPTPGQVRATNTGVIVNLSELTSFGGMCRMFNNDLVNPVTVGVFIPGISIFIPFMDILPQEFYVIRLSQYLQTEEPGTGSSQFGLSELMIRSIKGTTTLVTVEAFDP